MSSNLLHSRLRRAATTMAAGAIWGLPGSFRLTRVLGQSYWLRSIVFHHISSAESPFTAGIRVGISAQKLEEALRFLTAYYVPVSLEDVLSECDGRGLPDRAVLVTFDDAYRSVAELAAPLCRQFGVPAVFFVNAAFLDNRRLAPDNLVCYVAKVHGMETINAAARTVPGRETGEVRTLAEVFENLFPTVTLTEREVFLGELRRLAGIDEERMAREANLYLTSEQLRGLASFDFEIGNHTYTHTHCRLFEGQDFAAEVDRNKAELEARSKTKVRSFSQPYGSSKDVTAALVTHLQKTGHETAFLSESVANPRDLDLFHLDRVSSCAESEDQLFLEVEVLARLRRIRNRLFRRQAIVQAA